MRGYATYALDGDKLKVRKDENLTVRKGGNGFGISERQVMYTLNTVDRHMVGICELDREPAGKRRGKT